MATDRSWFENVRGNIQHFQEVGVDYMKSGEHPCVILVAAVVFLFNALPFLIFLVFGAVTSAVIFAAAILVFCIALVIGTLIYLPVLLVCTVGGVVVASFIILVSCFFESKTSPLQNGSTSSNTAT